MKTYNRFLTSRIKKLEKQLNLNGQKVLFIDLNSDGTYGKDNLTEKQTDQYIKDKGYQTVIIDDIPLDD